MLSQHDQNDQSSLISAEDEELVDEYHAQLRWLYNEYGIGWLSTRLQRDAARQEARLYLVCLLEQAKPGWEDRRNTHGDGDCCCWCEAARTTAPGTGQPVPGRSGSSPRPAS